MVNIKVLEPYEDEQGNRIEYSGPPVTEKIDIQFLGAGNTLTVADSAKVMSLSAKFTGDHSSVEIAETTKKRTGLRFGLTLGQQSRITIGSNVGAASKAFVRASEGASVALGDDCMLASSVEIRTDDTHAIYDIGTGLRTNPARDITIGEHVWIGKYAAIFGGVTIGSGSIIGFRSIVTKDVPNNAVAAGVPARVVRKNVAWERPNLDKNPLGTETMPSGQRKSEAFWNKTENSEPAVVSLPKPGRFVRVRRRIGRFLAR
ncbi:MAG: acyltransferase [Ancrocorticia sp.]|uniref:acyltransferase n=1 Tax=Ancrocorticia sp. TaxID=2593684 RepID=UPI003F908B7F